MVIRLDDVGLTRAHLDLGSVLLADRQSAGVNEGHMACLAALGAGDPWRTPTSATSARTRTARRWCRPCARRQRASCPEFVSGQAIEVTCLHRPWKPPLVPGAVIVACRWGLRVAVAVAIARNGR